MKYPEPQSEGITPYKKYIKFGVIGMVTLWLAFQLFGYNPAGYRVVKVNAFGEQSVIFSSGPYIDFFSKIYEYPDIITLNFTGDASSSSIEVAPISIRFNEGASADAKGIIKFALPKDEKMMVKIHNDYRSAENLGLTGLKTFGIECIKNSAQLMSSEMHYMGGRSTMSQYFQDQLENGVFILKTTEQIKFDSSTNEKSRYYLTEIMKDDKHQVIRKKSVLTQYNIQINDASISDVDYEEKIDKLLGQKIDATTKTSISKQNLMKAQQDALTAEATGKKTLVDIEYQEKQNQTREVIKAQTSVQLAEQDKQKQKIALDASYLEAQKIKTLADAEAYQKQRVMQADGALKQNLDAKIQMNKDMWDAIAKYQGPSFVPTTVMGGSGKEYNALETLMNLQVMGQFGPARK